MLVVGGFVVIWTVVNIKDPVLAGVFLTPGVALMGGVAVIHTRWLGRSATEPEQPPSLPSPPPPSSPSPS